MRAAISAATLCSLFTFATSASAECAWVFWYETTIWGSGLEGSNVWTVLGAYPTKPVCEEHLTAKMEDRYQHYKKEKELSANPERIDTIDYKGNMISTTFQWTSGQRLTGGKQLRYLCLPDTVDPRGPKGTK